MAITKETIKELVREVLKEAGPEAHLRAPALPPTPIEEKHLGFKKLVKQLVKKGIPREHESYLREATDEELAEGAEALAAWIGRKKYGKEKYQKMAAAGRRK